MNRIRRFLIARRVRRLAARQSALLAERSAMPERINRAADELYLARKAFDASCGGELNLLS